jgi:electron transport complex protein RnfB
MADINQCPPGGDQGIRDLADLLGVSPKPLNIEFGLHKPASVAFIIEQDCIGCVKCILACPVDAIVGAAKLMHTVISSECTGCELCIAPCPVDCIIMLPVNNAEQSRAEKSAQAKKRYDARCLRKEKAEVEKAERSKQKRQALLNMQAAKK